MLIMPSTTIRILKNCPLDPTYDHTIYFSNKTAQINYFSSLAKYTLAAQSYQRVKRGAMRVDRKAEELYDCNYLMFQNMAFGNKWFYAFITSVEYINDVTSEIRFQIDVMQTWFFDYTLDHCFVEREHSTTDVAGDNLVTEPIGYGDYMCGNQQIMVDANVDWKICVASSVQSNDTWLNPIEASRGGFYNQNYSQVNFYYFDADEDGIDQVKTIIDKVSLTRNTDFIIDIFMIPESLIVDATNEPTAATETTYYANKITSVGGYTPRNKKLLTYPYCFLSVDNMNGQTMDLHYEYFKDDTLCTFKYFPVMTVPPKLVMYPVNYGTDDSTGNTFDRTIINTAFPKCPYATNDFGAKMVQMGIGVALGGLVGGAGGAASAALSSNSANSAPQLPPPTLRPDGYFDIPSEQNVNNSGLNIGNLAPITGALAALSRGFNVSTSNVTSGEIWNNKGRFGFVCTDKHIRPDFAKILDDYFDRFGYATLRNKIPNTHSRPHWNYVKTQACTITGSIPADDAKAICDIYNRGITFWKNGSEVGNYSLNNTI